MYSKECGADYDSLDPGRGLLTPEPQVGGWDWMGGWMGFWGHVSRRVICGTGRVQDALCTVLTVLTVLTELKTTQSTPSSDCTGTAAITTDILVRRQQAPQTR